MSTGYVLNVSRARRALTCSGGRETREGSAVARPQSFCETENDGGYYYAVDRGGCAPKKVTSPIAPVAIDQFSTEGPSGVAFSSLFLR
mmetsp:Transcript_21352/g.87207  ORF Transcript_21352/g.87207 Transcript_21352/m.87207 type:complete len:88 (-) Transcript_21352:456-719(-)